jgi:hypothetical protein
MEVCARPFVNTLNSLSHFFILHGGRGLKLYTLFANIWHTRCSFEVTFP